jgi:hypothetical protein
MRFRKPKQVDYQASEAGTVGVANMARILGITHQHLSDLARAGRVPTTIVGGARRYDVDQVLAMAPQRPLPLPPLRRPGSYLEDTLWACEALSRGPWNLPTARTGRAWFLYLYAKQNKIVCRQLTQFALKLAEWNSEHERSSSGMLGGDGEDSRPTRAEQVLKGLDMDLVDGPFAVEPPDEPVPGSGATDY